MLGFVVWLGLLAAAGLCFPRRPQVSGLLFIALGVWSVILRYTTFGSPHPVSLGIALGSAGVWFSLGIMHLVRFRDPEARSAHVRRWTT